MPHEPMTAPLSPDPAWFKDAIIYEIHIRAFADSNADGIGDLNGLTSKLDYLQDLGITAIWLLPFYPSPLRDGGYDIADYTSINPAYGTVEDFQRLLDEAHRRGLRVITELVLNHTSSEHAWFQRARRAPPGSRWRNFYVWSDTPEPYRDARIIFKDFETSNWSWDPVAKAYYWHRFYSHQPDLNFDNPEVHDIMLQVVDFWLEMGVDGLRLDAVPYLYEREGTNCENLPETHAFLKKLRKHVDSRFRDRMLLAEANQWPQDAAAYFGDGDECHMNFHFPLMPRMFMSVQLEDRFPIVDILRQTPAIPENTQWATFLRNHDELTLEMVTDEDRDYMYRVYAEDPTARINLGIRRRLAPLLRGRRKIELMKGLLMSLPGTPVLYYGDEIGMGDNIYLGDRDGVRTPMQWTADRNAGFSMANPQRLYLPIIRDREYHFEALNVEAQQANPSSLLWWTKRLIALRKEHHVLGAGTIEFLLPDNHKVLAFIRALGEERVLVVANLSRFTQHTELELSSLEGLIPVEMFGRVRFPVIGKNPYFLSLGPHTFFWFALERPSTATTEEGRLPTLRPAASLGALLADARTAKVLASFTAGRRWFRSKGRSRKSARILDTLELESASLVILQIEYDEGDPETYLLAPSFVTGEAAGAVEGRRQTVIAAAKIGESDGLLVDALATGAAATPLVELSRREGTIPGTNGSLVAAAHDGMKETADRPLPPARAADVEQTNSVFPVADHYLLKVFREIELGKNPELEMGAYLSARPGEHIAPRLLGSLRWRPRGAKEDAALGSIHELVHHEGSGWDVTLDSLERFFERVLTSQHGPPVRTRIPWTARAREEADEGTRALLGTYVEQARRLGRKTGLFHLAMSTTHDDPAFAPEPFTSMHQQSIYQRARTMMVKTFQVLRRQLLQLPEEARGLATALLGSETALDERLRAITRHKVDIDRIRTHGDLHLGQVLSTGDDFLLIDFEGEPARKLHERRYKRAALRDATGMLRSFGYAAESALRLGPLRTQDIAALEPWARLWVEWISAFYLSAYFQTLEGTRLLPSTDLERERLLDFYALEKCLYEIHYELHNRPAWLVIPLRGMLELLAQEPV